MQAHVKSLKSLTHMTGSERIPSAAKSFLFFLVAADCTTYTQCMFATNIIIVSHYGIDQNKWKKVSPSIVRFYISIGCFSFDD